MSAIDFISLIYKQLANEISPEDAIALKNWIESDVENEMLAASIQIIWENSEPTNTLPTDISIDLDQEFASLMERVNAENQAIISPSQPIETPVIEIQRRFSKRKFWSVAAGLALVIGLSWFFIAQNKAHVNFAELKTGEEPKEILLADGTTVYLNANSTLKYPSEFSGKSRTVLFSGEAFFDVAKDSEHPFIIRTPYENVTVLGTSFNVRAYENEANSEIAVSSGSVQVSAGANAFVIQPNEKVIVDRANKALELKTTEKLNELAWHTKSIQFSNSPLSEVIRELEKFYHVSLSLENKALENCAYTDAFGIGELPTALASISKVFGITINQTANDAYVLVGGDCQ